MQQTSSIDPSRDPSRIDSHSKPDKRAFEAYLKYSQIQAQREVLEKYDALLNELISQISHQDAESVDIRIDPQSRKTEIQVKEETNIKWQKCQELQSIFTQMSSALQTGNPEKALTTLLQMAKAQVDNKVAAHPSYQRTLNATMKEVFEEDPQKGLGVENLTLRLYMAKWAGQAVKKWGQSLPMIQKAAVQTLEDQLTTNEDNATPFKEAAAQLSDEIAFMDNEQLKQFTQPETEKQLRQELLNAIMLSMVKPNVKSALQRGEANLTRESSAGQLPKAEEEIRTQIRSKNVLKFHFIDKAFEEEMATIDNAIWRLEKKITNLSPRDQEKLAALKAKAQEIKDAYSSLNQEIRTTGIVELLTGIGDLLHFNAEDSDKANVEQKVIILHELQQTLDQIRSNAAGGTEEMKKLVEDLDKKINAFDSIKKFINETIDLVQKLPNLSQDEYIKLFKNYIDLSKMKGLAPDVQKQVDAIKSAISTAKVLTPNGNIPLLDVMASAYIASQLPTPPISGADILIKEHQIQKELREQLDKSDFDCIYSDIFNHDPSGSIWTDPVTGKHVFLPAYKLGFYDINKEFGNHKDIKIQNLDDLKSLAKTISTSLDLVSADLISQKKTLIYSIEQVKSILARSQEFYDLSLKLTKAYQTGQSITEMFRDAILGDYTTNLELALRKLACQLTHKTFTSKAFGDIASKITNWANVNNTSDPPNGLNFDAWYKNYEATHPKDSSDPAKKYNIEDVKKMADKELDALKQLKASGEQAGKVIDDKLKETDEKLANGDITKDQADETKKKLMEQKEAIGKTMGSIDALSKKVADVKEGISKASDPREYMKSKIEDIGKAEILVVNGDSATNIQGLSNFQRNLMTEGSAYASQGEALQIKLGQTFTNMQMNYTTITSCMQILNRMISTSIMAVKGQ